VTSLVSPVIYLATATNVMQIRLISVDAAIIVIVIAGTIPLLILLFNNNKVVFQKNVDIARSLISTQLSPRFYWRLNKQWFISIMRVQHQEQNIMIFQLLPHRR
jgi:hypothetical protein